MTWGTQDRTSIPVSTPLHQPLYLVPSRTLSFLPSTSLGLELFAQYTPSFAAAAPPSSHHFRVVGANAPSNGDIILLLALQILSL